MDSRWNIQTLIVAVLFLVLGCFSQGIADNKKILITTSKGIVQKTAPSGAKNVKPLSLPDLTVARITILPGNPKASGNVTVEV